MRTICVNKSVNIQLLISLEYNFICASSKTSAWSNYIPYVQMFLSN